MLHNQRHSNAITYRPISTGGWSATTQTSAGPFTAIGDTMAEAKQALDALVKVLLGRTTH
jgi:hypothetical protein